MRIWSAILFLAVLLPESAGAALDQPSIQYLENIWLVGQKPDQGDCLSHWYLQTQIEFEFRKTGGRVLSFEPYDLWTAIAAPQVEKTGDTLTFHALSRDGRLLPYIGVRLLPPDRIEIMPAPDNPDVSKPQIAYRCGAPDRSVDESVPLEALSVLTPPLTGGQSLPEAQPDITDADLCRGSKRPKAGVALRGLQFEVLGPSHFWLFGSGFGHRFSFDFVRHVEQTAPHSLKLTMQEHLEQGGGWDVPLSRGKIYELTVIDKGGRVEIPELSTSFVRCNPADRGGFGMHRW